MYLPEVVYDIIEYELADESKPDAVNLTMHFPLYPDSVGTTPINMTVTQQMLDEYVFVKAPTNYQHYKLGLYLMRYVETMAVTYVDEVEAGAA